MKYALILPNKTIPELVGRILKVTGVSLTTVHLEYHECSYSINIEFVKEVFPENEQ